MASPINEMAMSGNEEIEMIIRRSMSFCDRVTSSLAESFTTCAGRHWFFAPNCTSSSKLIVMVLKDVWLSSLFRRPSMSSISPRTRESSFSIRMRSSTSSASSKKLTSLCSWDFLVDKRVCVSTNCSVTSLVLMDSEWITEAICLRATKACSKFSEGIRSVIVPRRFLWSSPVISRDMLSPPLDLATFVIVSAATSILVTLKERYPFFMIFFSWFCCGVFGCSVGRGVIFVSGGFAKNSSLALMSMAGVGMSAWKNSRSRP